MNQRERILASIAALIVGYFGVTWFVKRFITEPVALKDSELAILTKKLDEKRHDLQKANDAEFDINRWRDLALPKDESRAKTRYSELLRKKLADAGVEKPTLGSPTTRAFQNDYTRHTFQVTAKCTLGQLTKFLLSFYQADMLHQIRRLDIKPVIEKDKLKEFDVTITIDAVSMNDAMATNDLPKPQAPTYKNPFANRKIEEFKFIVDKNVFQPTVFVSKELAATRPRERPSGDRDERANYLLTGTVFADDVAHLWLTDTSSKKRIAVKQGEDISITGFKAKVLEVGAGEVLLQVGPDVGIVRLGKSLATWTKLQPASVSVGTQ